MIIIINMNTIANASITANQGNQFKATFYLVFDFCEHDLAGLLSNVNVKFSPGEIKKVDRYFGNCQISSIFI